MAVCPKDCLEHAGTLNRYGVYPVRMRKDAACIGCSQCAIMCPDAAIEVFKTVAEEAGGKNCGAAVPAAQAGETPAPQSAQAGETPAPQVGEDLRKEEATT
jgi:2-oxoglutarate ferredoxin oxidoreductase subunit delta